MKKRLQWSRLEDPQGVVLYKAKRKTEQALIVPQPEGGYAVLYKSRREKKRAIVSTLNEGKEAAETMRVSARRNPVTIPNMAIVGFGVGVIGTLSYFMWKQQQTPKLVSSPSAPNDIYISITPGQNNVTWTSGTTLFVNLPVTAHGWVSFNGNVISGTQPLQLPDNPVGTFTIIYQDSNFVQQTATLTVTQAAIQPGV